MLLQASSLCVSFSFFFCNPLSILPRLLYKNNTIAKISPAVWTVGESVGGVREVTEAKSPGTLCRL
jgi:hypothetical protein